MDRSIKIFDLKNFQFLKSFLIPSIVTTMQIDNNYIFTVHMDKSFSIFCLSKLEKIYNDKPIDS